MQNLSHYKDFNFVKKGEQKMLTNNGHLHFWLAGNAHLGLMLSITV